MSRKFLGGIDLQAQRATNAADPTTGTDLATKQYVDNLSAGISWKDSVRVATTANGTLATAFANSQVVDGVTLATGNRILLKNQTTGQDNGIYVVQAAGAPVRATDADTAAELQGSIVTVEEGTVNADKAFQLTTDAITLGTTPQVWSAFAVGQAYTGSNGVLLTGSNFTVQALDSSITVAAGGISTSRSAIGATGKYAADVGAMTGGTPITITHSLGTLDVHVQVRQNSDGQVVEPDILVASTNTITLTSAAAVSAAVLRVVVIG